MTLNQTTNVIYGFIEFYEIYLNHYFNVLKGVAMDFFWTILQSMEIKDSQRTCELEQNIKFSGIKDIINTKPKFLFVTFIQSDF
jgi:hypothetical protein